jgi:hypothetical protein
MYSAMPVSSLVMVHSVSQAAVAGITTGFPFPIGLR